MIERLKRQIKKLYFKALFQIFETLLKMASVLRVSIHSDLSEFPTEKRYDPNVKISELKKKLELITGYNHVTMKVFLSINEKEIGELDDHDKTLVQYVGESMSSDEVLKLVVKDEQKPDVFDSNIPKYTISEEKYQERPNNVRNFIKEVREKQLS